MFENMYSKYIHMHTKYSVQYVHIIGTYVVHTQQTSTFLTWRTCMKPSQLHCDGPFGLAVYSYLS